MKTPSRIPKNGSRRAAVPQVKSPRAIRVPPLDPAAAALPRSVRTVICIFRTPDGKEFARVDFPRKVFTLIQRTACDRGITVAELFHNAIEAYCNKHGVYLSNKRSAR
jgi:hypothetical protein